eukprot:10859787-Alexandrium_andersonii.AAC.1
MARPEGPVEVDGVGDDIRERREGDALAMVEETIDQGPPETPCDPVLHGRVGPELRDQREAVDGEVARAEVCPDGVE